MEVGIFGDYNSFTTGQSILERIWNMMEGGKEGLKVKEGWEFILARKYNKCNFEITVGQSNQEIINRLATDIAYNPKDLYIVQTGSWYNTATGIVDYNEERYQVLPNLTYNMINPLTHIGKRYEQSKRPHHPNFILREPPGAGREEGYEHIPTVFHAFLEDPDMISRPMHEFNDDIEDKLRMESTYGDFVKVTVKDHLGSRLKQDDNFGLISNLNLLSQHHNVWYFHWDPPLGRVEDFSNLEEQHDIDPIISDWRKKNRREKLGFYTAKLERLNTNKRIHPFSVMDYLIMSHREEIEKDVDDKGFLGETLHNIIFNEYISSNDTLMEILANG